MYKVTLVTFVLVLFSISQVGCVKPVKIEGIAMLPNYKDGEKYFIDTNVKNLERGDVITFLYPKDKTKYFIKRVIGLPNETVKIENGVVSINGNPLEEPYLDQIYNQSMPNLSETRISDNNYFVLGDNRDNSSDSRIWGTVSKDLIQGKLWYKYGESKDQ